MSTRIHCYVTLFKPRPLQTAVSHVKGRCSVHPSIHTSLLPLWLHHNVTVRPEPGIRAVLETPLCTPLPIPLLPRLTEAAGRPTGAGGKSITGGSRTGSFIPAASSRPTVVTSIMIAEETNCRGRVIRAILRSDPSEEKHMCRMDADVFLKLTFCRWIKIRGRHFFTI